MKKSIDKEDKMDLLREELEESFQEEFTHSFYEEEDYTDIHPIETLEKHNQIQSLEENDQMESLEENDQMENVEDNDQMESLEENDQIESLEENDQIESLEENDQMESLEENDQMESLEENDQIESLEENDQIENVEENDQIESLEENDQIESLEENDQIESLEENDQMENVEENDQMENVEENDQMENVEVDYGLEEKGYLFLKQVYSKDLVDRFYYEVQSFINLEGIYSHLQKRQDVPQQHYFVNNTYGALQNFNQLQHYYVPVIDNRGTYNRVTDVGVIDFFNIDRLLPQVKTYFDVGVMQAILLKTTGIEWKLTRTNLQIYNNVSNTNQYHVDTGNEKNIKFTIFISNILDEMNGAPAFIEGSHLNKKNVKLSQSKIFTGERGSVLISYQNGYHRKMSMKTGGINIFLTFHFTTKYERDRYLPL